MPRVGIAPRSPGQRWQRAHNVCRTSAVPPDALHASSSGALLGRLVGRRVPASAAGPPGVTQAGVGGLAPLPGRAQALPQRLDVLPAGARGPRCPAVCRRGPAPLPPPLPPPRWAPGWAACAGRALGEGAPLEEPRQKTPVLPAGAD